MNPPPLVGKLLYLPHYIHVQRKLHLYKKPECYYVDDTIRYYKRKNLSLYLWFILADLFNNMINGINLGGQNQSTGLYYYYYNISIPHTVLPSIKGNHSLEKSFILYTHMYNYMHVYLKIYIIHREKIHIMHKCTYKGIFSFSWEKANSDN